MDSLLRQWNERYFDGRLSPAVLNIFDALALSTQSETVKGVLERQFQAMKLTHFQATDFTDDLARNLYGVLNLFTKTWNGTPPPITLAGRHVAFYWLKPLLAPSHNYPKFTGFPVGEMG